MLTLRLPFLGKSKNRRGKSRKVSKREIFSRRMWVLGFATSAIAVVMLLTAPIIHGYLTPGAQASLAPAVDLSSVKAKPVTNQAGYKHGTGVLTESQLKQLAAVNPSLHARILKSIGQNKPVVVSFYESQTLSALTEKSNQEIKAAGLDAALITALVVTIVYIYAELKKNNFDVGATAGNLSASFLTTLFTCLFTLFTAPICLKAPA